MERAHVSIVCVFNDPVVRAACLDRSIEAGLTSAPETEYLPIDNTGNRFASAGAALNEGARRARNDVVVFVHQDVYLHSLGALERAAARLLADPTVGLVGAVGVSSSGAVSGVVRDRVVMIGQPASPVDGVDSVDEVLFMITRERVLASPLSEQQDLAWHAYAVEYGARVRSRDLRVITADLPLTHNSMTVNLDRLAEAHQRVALLYPELTPMQTTCGVVRTTSDRGPLRTALRRRQGAATWWRDSLAATSLARAAGEPTRGVVLGDVRLAVDDALDLAGATGLDVVNLDVAVPGDWSVDALTRRGRDVAATAAPAATLDDLPPRADDRALLVTGLDEVALARLAPALRATPHLIGVWRDTGAWLLCHPGAARARSLWTTRRSAPFGRRAARSTAVPAVAGEPAPAAG